MFRKVRGPAMQWGSPVACCSELTGTATSMATSYWQWRLCSTDNARTASGSAITVMKS